MGGMCCSSSVDGDKECNVTEKKKTDFARKARSIEDDSEESFNETDTECAAVTKKPDLVEDSRSSAAATARPSDWELDSVDIADEQLLVGDDTDDEHWGVGTPMSEASERDFPDFESEQLEEIVEINQLKQLVALGKGSSGISALRESEPTGIEEALHPPLDRSTLQMELVVFNMCDEVMPPLARPRSLSRSFGRRRSSSRSLAKRPPKRTVQVKANYLRGSKSTLRKSAKHNSREFDNNIVDIRETIELEMETGSDGRLVGHIEVLAKQMTGKLKKDKVIGYASIPLALSLKSGLIATNGDRTDMTLEFFAKSKAQLKKERKKGAEYEPIADQPVVARMDVRFRLILDRKLLHEFQLRIAAEQKTECLTTTNPLDLMKLYTARLKLDIVGAVMSQDSVAAWMKMGFAEMCATMKQMGSKVALAEPSDANSHVMIRVERRVHGAHDDVRRGEEYVSKTEDSCYIGEQFVFDVAPFFQHSSTRTVADSISFGHAIHPELEYYEFAEGEENPGYLLLTVQKTKRKGGRLEHGCGLLKICSLLQKATLAPGSKKSEEAIFVETMFKPLTRATRKKQRKQPLLETGFLLCKCRFEWQ